MHRPGVISQIRGVAGAAAVPSAVIRFPVKTDSCYEQKMAAYNAGTEKGSDLSRATYIDNVSSLQLYFVDWFSNLGVPDFAFV